jgi:hypothetical protein
MTSGRVLRAGRCGIRGHGKAHFLAEGAGYVRCPKPRRAGVPDGVWGRAVVVMVSLSRCPPAMAARAGRRRQAGQARLGAGNNGPVSTAAASSFLDAAPEALVTVISGGQPVIFVRNGRPVAVVIDVDSYEEAEVALAAGA